MSFFSFRNRRGNCSAEVGQVTSGNDSKSNSSAPGALPVDEGEKFPGPVVEEVGSTLSNEARRADVEKGDAQAHTQPVKDGVPIDEFDNDPELKDLPWHVRRVVSLEDDPTLPILTFRYFVLSFLFITPGAFLSQMSAFRTTSAPYSVFFVQIASNYVGIWLAKILPAKTVRVPFTRWSFSLNAGPWSVKEHVLVTISAASGAISNLASTPIAMAELYFGQVIHPAVAIFFMWAIVWTGYSFAAIARQFLLYDPAYPWPQALCQTALFETQNKQRTTGSKLARKQMIVFFSALLGVTLWQFLPEYVFPFVSSLAFLCWVAPHNATANFIGSGLGGMGFMNLSLDWSNMSQYVSLFLAPWWAQVVVFMGFAVSCWILMPAAKFGGLGGSDLNLMSNRLFMTNGSAYPINALMTPDVSFNQTAYDFYGPIHVGTHQLWAMFFDYASYTSALVWVAVFGYGQIKSTVEKLRARSRGSNDESINHQYGDRLNILQRSYKEVPFWWYLALFLCSFVILIAVLAKGSLYIPLWTYIIALVTGALVVSPMGWLYAISNFQVEIGTFNELLYGLMVNSVSGHRNPAGATVYSSIAGDAWYRAQYMLQDQKIGHYMHIPPRDVFFSQVFGTLIGVPVNYGVIRWILNTKADYLSGKVDDPNHQWTGQTIASSLTTGVQYVLVGPKRLFELEAFKPLPYAFLVGAGTPVVLYVLHRFFPRAKFNLWNSTIFFSSLSVFYGNISTGYFSSLLGGFVVMFWAYRYKYELWSRYNYILAASFDAGFNFNMLLIFLLFGAGKIISMPNWWGNNEDSVERCFALVPDVISASDSS